jgi:hypothetical protein
MIRFIAVAVAVLAAGCAAPAARAPVTHRAAATPRATSASASAPAVPVLTARQQRKECAYLRAASKVPDASAVGNADGFWGVEWLAVAQYNTDTAGAYAILSKAVADRCPSLSWTLQQMQQQ